MKTIIFVFLIALFGIQVSFAQADVPVTVRVLNDTGRTAMARSVKVDGAKLVANGCLRWVPSGSTCQIAVHKSALTAIATIDFDGVQKVVSF